MKTVGFQLSARAAHQRGATLIVLLVMLVVITLLALSTVRSTTMDERMAGNARDRDKAFQAAEAAVQACLTQVNNKSYPAASVLTPVAATADDAVPNWDRDATWSDDAKSTEVDIGDDTLAHKPRCMVETLGAESYRVTGKAYGGGETTVVMLQATYSQE